MHEELLRAVITNIIMAVHVISGSGKSFHENRPAHGIVMNDSVSARMYRFSDGCTLETKSDEIFYLPKGSTYHVQDITVGDCYAINFELDREISVAPFTIQLRDAKSARTVFQHACKNWESSSPYARASIYRDLYDIICRVGAEFERNYMPTVQERLIAPAVERIHQSFQDSELSVRELAEQCRISEAYFRRLFYSKYGVSPMEYILRLRTEQAKQLLAAGGFTVSEIAERCGYSEPCYFSHEFRKRVGVPPSAYRRSIGI